MNNNCNGITADSIKEDLTNGIFLSLNPGGSGYLNLYNKIANKCKLEFKMRNDGGTLLHAMATGKFKNDKGKDVSGYFNSLIKYIEKFKRRQFINILSQIDLNNLQTQGGKTPLDLANDARNNENVKNKNKPTISLFQKMLEEAIMIRNHKKNSTTSLSSLSNNQSKKEIISVICSHESRIKCYLKNFPINDYTKDKVVKIEFYKGSVQKIKIGDSNVYSMKTINNNVKRISNNMNYKYIFYIFSCQTDDNAMNEINSNPRYKNVNIVNINGLTRSEKNSIINSLNTIKKYLPSEPNYLFSSDLKRSMIDMIYMYPQKKIIVLPCCHPTADINKNQCNGIRSSSKNTPGQNLLPNIIWKYYEDFYGEGQRRTGSGSLSRFFKMEIKMPAFGRKHCSYTNFIEEAVEIIKKEKLAEQ